MKEQFKIGGISCSFCAQTIQKALSRTAGVNACSVNMAHEEALVEYDPQLIDTNKIKEIFRSLGYTVRDPHKIRDFEAEERALRTELWRTLLATLFSLAVVAEMYLMGVHIMLPYRRWLLFAMAAFVAFGLGRHIIKKAVMALRRGIFNQHLLLTLGVLGGFIGGALGFFFEIPDFFGIAVLLVNYHLLNGWISGLVRMRASKAVKKLLELQPLEARVLRDGQEKLVPIEAVKVGDLVLIRPGEKIPVDGIVEEGASSVDQALVSGEPIPVDKVPGDEVIGGSFNKNGLLKIRTTRVGEESFIRKVAKYVEESKALKPSIVLLADRILSFYVPTVIGISITSFSAWYLGSWALAGQPNLLKAVYAAVSVLVIGYPCALGMATPMALVRGGGLAAERGILIRSGEALQSFKDIQKIVLDKTGTLTQGRPKVVEVIPLNGFSTQELLQQAASAERHSEHPLAEAIVKYAQAHGIDILEPEGFQAMPGHGVEAQINGAKVLVGNRRLIAQHGLALDSIEAHLKQLEHQGRTAVLVSIESQLAGIIAISDPLKEDAKAAIAQFKKLKIEPVMLTGDNRRTAEAVAREAGISEIFAQVLPHQKADKIRELQKQGFKVAMVGDGINDAPALMQADVGIAIGAGTDIAIESSDIILIRDELLRVADAYFISRDTYRKTAQNLTLAFLFNGIGIPVAALGLLHPLHAMGAMLASVATIQFNSWAFKLLLPARRGVEAKAAAELALEVPGIRCSGCIKSKE